jgi:hypothetical protein
MRYEHLIEINDPLFPLIDPLSRDDLWEGLVLRAYAPQQFIQGLEDAKVKELSCDDSTTVLARTLDYGMFRVDDRVTLHKMESLITDVAAGAGMAKSRLTITIEEPARDLLYLRFLYEFDEDEADGELDRLTVAIREQAYYASDMDTVARIRELAESRRMH